MALLPLETVPGRHDFTFGTGRRVALCCAEFTEQQLRMCKWSPLWSLPHREKGSTWSRECWRQADTSSSQRPNNEGFSNGNPGAGFLRKLKTPSGQSMASPRYVFLWDTFFQPVEGTDLTSPVNGIRQL